MDGAPSAEGLQPPAPNSTPEEIQAWNHMMETMVTFIKASTHLMNTINEKMQAGCDPMCKVLCKDTVSHTPEVVITPPTPERPETGTTEEKLVEETKEVGDACNCAALRAKRQADATGVPGDLPTQKPSEQLCPCPPSDNRDALMQKMTEKLESAQREIDLLQREMMKLKAKRMGPDTAVLYRQIMKDSDDQPKSIDARRRLFDSTSDLEPDSGGVFHQSGLQINEDEDDCNCDVESSDPYAISTIWPPPRPQPQRSPEYGLVPSSMPRTIQQRLPRAQLYQDPGMSRIGSALPRRLPTHPQGAGRPRVPIYGDSPPSIRRSPTPASCMLRLAVYQDFLRSRGQPDIYPPTEAFQSLASSVPSSSRDSRCGRCDSCIMD